MTVFSRRFDFATASAFSVSMRVISNLLASVIAVWAVREASVFVWVSDLSRSGAAGSSFATSFAFSVYCQRHGRISSLTPVPDVPYRVLLIKLRWPSALLSRGRTQPCSKIPAEEPEYTRKGRTHMLNIRLLPPTGTVMPNMAAM